MNNTAFFGKEEQIASSRLTRWLSVERNNLLASVAGQRVACHAKAKLHKAAAIDAPDWSRHPRGRACPGNGAPFQ